MVESTGSQDDDTPEAGKGNDPLWDAAADRSVLDGESETDTIHDVEVGQDTLVLKIDLKFADLDIKQRGECCISGWKWGWMMLHLNVQWAIVIICRCTHQCLIRPS